MADSRGSAKQNTTGGASARAYDAASESLTVAVDPLHARQLVHKKWRAARSAILFSLWLPKYARELRTVSVRTSVRKTCFLIVRLYRWLRRARFALTGVEPPKPVLVELPTKETKTVLSLTKPQRYQAAPPRRPQLFMALNRNEVTDYTGTMQNQIDGQKKVHDNVLTLAQKSISESVIYYDGDHLTCARLDPKLFLEDSALRQHQTNDTLPEGCLTNVCYIDVAESGRVLEDKGALSKEGKVICMCQHPSNSQIFASCHSDHVKVWSYFGTDRKDDDKAAVLCDSIFLRDSKKIVYGMVFLSEVPEWIAEQQGHVLMMLTGMPQHPWLMIEVIAVFRNSHMVVHQRIIGRGGKFLESARLGKIIFQISHSDRILIVAGKNVAMFYDIRRIVPEGGNGDTCLELDLIKAPENRLDLDFDTQACLCLPPPKACDRMGALDWIVLSDSEGDLYGFLWLEENDRVVPCSKNMGRFSSRETKHDRGVPISLLAPTFGATPHCHYKNIKEKGQPYSLYLERLGYERDRFFAFGDNGKLVSWTLGKTGWTSQVEFGIFNHLEDTQLSVPEDGPQFVAAHSSRLVPHVLVAMDQKNQKMICFDTMNMNEEPTPPEAMCWLGA